MAAKITHIPVYMQFIQELEKGFRILDDLGQEEMTGFIRSQQHQDGFFTDRAGNPDMYYSLFGTWLSKALTPGDVLNQLIYAASREVAAGKTMDKMSLLMIRISLQLNFRKPGLIRLFYLIFIEGKNLNASYQMFLFMLVYDSHYGPDRVMKGMLKSFMRFRKPSKGLPCSFMAAMLFVKTLSGMDAKEEEKLLMEYFETGKGFKSFPEQEHADMLSTAVALFALSQAGTDLRIIKPDCLKLALENYSGGAFLSGDGDMIRDLEYTFYGLLTLGLLSQDE